MKIKLAGFTVFSLFLLMLVPAYANVTSLSFEKNFYTLNEDLKFIGTQDEGDIVFVIIRDASGKYKGMLSDPRQNQGEFSVIPRPITTFFNNIGIYNATAFTDEQREANGITIKVEFDGEKVFEVPKYVLQLNSVSDRIIDVEKTITFTVSLKEISVADAVFSLSGEPTGATIDSESGLFVWTPLTSHGNVQDVYYNFDIIVNSGSQTDKENIQITVKKAYDEPKKEPEPEKELTPEPEPITEPIDLGVASFVDETKDAQNYVDRYNNEASYKEWFDENYSEYDSIYQAVGIEEPLTIPASFVDETKDAQNYVDRYNNEASYKEWFDENYSEYDSIYQAVGLEAPDVEIVEEIVEPEFGECGEGTDLVGDTCVMIETVNGGGCLIATAAYGSELAPQVQFLREIRDNQLMNTDSGISFMTGFNQVYYSFSPIIADMERENPVFREAVKIGITPLLSSLSILSFAESESEILGYGIGIILMNIGMYFAVPAIIIFKAKKYIKI